MSAAQKNYDPVMHSTEHILNRVMINLFNCGRSVSTHLEKKKSKCDYPFDHELTPEERARIEKSVNEVIARNLDVKIYFVNPAEAPPMADVSKLPEEAFQEDIRIVEIGDFDVSACIGKHVSKTSEIWGRFRITTSTFENGILRLRWVVK
jgi:alanyl-tRNA synthetase